MRSLIKNAFVDRAFQMRMLRRAMFPPGLSGLIGAFLIFIGTNGDYSFTASDLRLFGLLGLFVLYMVNGVGVTWSLILYSSRVAGPLRNFRKGLEKIEIGDLTTRIQVRKDDELVEHAIHLNQTIQSLQERIRRVHQFCKFALSSVESMKQEKGASAELQKMEDLIRSIDESVRDFKI